jgi:hypothetical protein
LFLKNVKTGIESVLLIQSQQLFFQIEAMGSKNMVGPLENPQVKANGCEKQKSRRKYKENYFFSTASILLRGVAGGLRGSHVASGDFAGHGLPREGQEGPRGPKRASGGFGKAKEEAKKKESKGRTVEQLV